jgi:hypothetical protein
MSMVQLDGQCRKIIIVAQNKELTIKTDNEGYYIVTRWIHYVAELFFKSMDYNRYQIKYKSDCEKNLTSKQRLWVENMILKHQTILN